MAAAGLRTFAGRLRISEPEGLAFWTFVVAALLLVVPVVPRLLVVLAAFVGYLVVSGVMLMIAPRWWYRLLFTLITSIVMVTLLHGSLLGLKLTIDTVVLAWRKSVNAFFLPRISVPGCQATIRIKRAIS